MMRSVVTKRLRRLLRACGVIAYPVRKLPIGCDYRQALSDMNISPETVFDVGANIGQFALHCADHFPKARIIAFEPVGETFRHLLEQTAPHGSIECVNVACGDEIGIVELFLHDRSTMNSLHPDQNVNSHQGQRSERVSVTTIDQYARDHAISKIDLLKVDAEGFDLNVLQGAQEMFSSRRIGGVFVEVTFDPDQPAVSSFHTIAEFLSGHGFKPAGFYNQSVLGGGRRLAYCDALFFQQT